MLAGKTYWLIGASEGLGRAVALALDELGVRCVVSARNAERLQDLAGELKNDPLVVTCDVSDDASVASAWERVQQEKPFGVVYLAGYYDPISAPAWDRDAVVKMADVNFMGGVRCLGQVVPYLAARDAGHIVVIGSLSGYRGLPGAIGYGASKSAIMHLTENIHIDLAKTGVKTQLINPGFIKTRLTDKNTFDMPFIMSAEDAAHNVVQAMEGNRFKTDFPWMFSLLFRASRWFPNWLYVRVFAR